MEELTVKYEEIDDDEFYLDIKVDESILVEEVISQEVTAIYEQKFDQEMEFEKHKFLEDINCDIRASTYSKEDDAQPYPVCKKMKLDSQKVEYMANKKENRRKLLIGSAEEILDSFDSVADKAYEPHLELDTLDDPDDNEVNENLIKEKVADNLMVKKPKLIIIPPKRVDRRKPYQCPHCCQKPTVNLHRHLMTQHKKTHKEAKEIMSQLRNFDKLKSKEQRMNRNGHCFICKDNSLTLMVKKPKLIIIPPKRVDRRKPYQCPHCFKKPTVNLHRHLMTQHKKTHKEAKEIMSQLRNFDKLKSKEQRMNRKGHCFICKDNSLTLARIDNHLVNVHGFIRRSNELRIAVNKCKISLALTPEQEVTDEVNHEDAPANETNENELTERYINIKPIVKTGGLMGDLIKSFHSCMHSLCTKVSVKSRTRIIRQIEYCLLSMFNKPLKLNHFKQIIHIGDKNNWLYCQLKFSSRGPAAMKKYLESLIKFLEHIYIMFTSSPRLTPEDVREIINTLKRCITKCSRLYGEFYHKMQTEDEKLLLSAKDFINYLKHDEIVTLINKLSTFDDSFNCREELCTTLREACEIRNKLMLYFSLYTARRSTDLAGLKISEVLSPSIYVKGWRTMNIIEDKNQGKLICSFHMRKVDYAALITYIRLIVPMLNKAARLIEVNDELKLYASSDDMVHSEDFLKRLGDELVESIQSGSYVDEAYDPILESNTRGRAKLIDGRRITKNDFVFPSVDGGALDLSRVAHILTSTYYKVVYNKVYKKNVHLKKFTPSMVRKSFAFIQKYIDLDKAKVLLPGIKFDPDLSERITSAVMAQSQRTSKSNYNLSGWKAHSLNAVRVFDLIWSGKLRIEEDPHFQQKHEELPNPIAEDSLGEDPQIQTQHEELPCSVAEDSLEEAHLHQHGELPYRVMGVEKFPDFQVPGCNPEKSEIERLRKELDDMKKLIAALQLASGIKIPQTKNTQPLLLRENLKIIKKGK